MAAMAAMTVVTEIVVVIPFGGSRAGGSSSAVERQLPKLDVAGSIPVSRSIHSAWHFPSRACRVLARQTFSSLTHPRGCGYKSLRPAKGRRCNSATVPQL
jgi:hypothetical protein